MYSRGETTIWLVFGGLLGCISVLACIGSGPDRVVVTCQSDDTCLDVSLRVCQGDDVDLSLCNFCPDGAVNGFCSRAMTSMGACEFPGSCFEILEPECEFYGGRFLGPGTRCPGAGACVLEGASDTTADDLCVRSSPEGCEVTHGSFDQFGDCATGACELPDGSCEVLPERQCQVLSAVYLGDGVPCSPTGVCCRKDSCEESVTEEECIDGTFLEGVQSCDDVDCLEPTGACCAGPGGPCEDASTKADCTDGFFEGQSCAEIGCVPPPVGACIFPDGSCSVTTPAECDGGDFLGAGSICPPVGACIFPNGSCFITTIGNCDGGDFQGVGTSCPVQGGGGGGVPGTSLDCARECMEEVSSLLAACDAQGTSLGVCAPLANQRFQNCLEGCADTCARDCMTESSSALTLCLAFGTPLETCLSASRTDFGSCLSTCPANPGTDCLAAAASQLSDCLLGGGDPIECGQSADAFLADCLVPPPAMTPQVLGDCNQDGAVNVADVTCIVHYLFLARFDRLDRFAGATPCTTPDGDLAVLDVSGNGAINVVDIVALTRFLFRIGTPPAGVAECREIGADLGCPHNPGCP